MPIWYDPDIETDQEAMIVWDIESMEPGELSSEQADNLSAHWSNREAAIDREEQRRLALIAAAPVIVAPTPEVLTKLAAQRMRLQAKAITLAA